MIEDIVEVIEKIQIILYDSVGREPENVTSEIGTFFLKKCPKTRS